MNRLCLPGLKNDSDLRVELKNKINIFVEYYNSNKTNKELEVNFDELQVYLISYFEKEETVMYKYNYQNHISHIAQHEELLAVMTELKSELEKEYSADQGIHFKYSWENFINYLISHVNSEDNLLNEHVSKLIRS